MCRSVSVCLGVLVVAWSLWAGCGAESPNSANGDDRPVEYDTWNSGPGPDSDMIVAGITVQDNDGTEPGTDGWFSSGTSDPPQPQIPGQISAPDGGAAGDPGDGGPGDPNEGGGGDPNQGDPGDPNEGGAPDPNSGGGGDPNAPDFPVRLMPWLEFRSGGREEADELIDLCGYAQRMTDTVLVSTSPGGEWIYTELRQALPDLVVIPGARVIMIAPEHPIDSVARWQAVGDWTRQVVALTGCRRFVIECELPLYEYWNGAPFNHEQFIIGLWHLPAEVDYIFYPAGVVNGSESRLREMLPRALDLCRSVDVGLTHVVFETVGPATHPYHGERVYEQCMDVVVRGEGRRWLDHIVTGSVDYAWPIADVGTAVGLLRGPEAYLYVIPGDEKAVYDKVAGYFGEN